MFNSRVGNDNRNRMLNWIINLVFDAKFGSDEERMKRAQDITNCISSAILNKLSGLYLIDLGYVKDLRETMNISYEDYPIEYDNAKIKKFGLSENIFKRVEQHRKSYGKYSSKIKLDWFVHLPEDILSNAETNLNHYCTSKKIKFSFKDYKELIIVKPNQKTDLKKYYEDLISIYPNTINTITQKFNKEIEYLKAKYEIKLKDKDIELKDKDIELEKMRSQVELSKSHLELSKSHLENKDKDIEILMLKLKLSEKNNNGPV